MPFSRRALAIMGDAVVTVHGQAFSRIFKPKTFNPDDVLHGTLGLGTGTVKNDGRTMVRAAFAILDTAMAGKPYAGGNGFGIADCALFTIERWAPRSTSTCRRTSRRIWHG